MLVRNPGSTLTTSTRSFTSESCESVEPVESQTSAAMFVQSEKLHPDRIRQRWRRHNRVFVHNPRACGVQITVLEVDAGTAAATKSFPAIDPALHPQASS